MALDGGYYGSFEHAMANLAIGRRQGEEDGYKKGFSEGYNKALQEANQRIAELQAQYQAALDHEVMLGNLQKAVSVPARNVLGSLMQGNSHEARVIRAMFRNEYYPWIQESLNRQYISAPPEQNELVAREMPQARKFILQALQD